MVVTLSMELAYKKDAAYMIPGSNKEERFLQFKEFGMYAIDYFWQHQSVSRSVSEKHFPKIIQTHLTPQNIIKRRVMDK